jgi:glycosyltransferase involved in cell wall biosynthesis
MGEFAGVKIAHAAVSSGMMTNFGRLFTQRLVEEGADVHYFASTLPVYGALPNLSDMRALGVTFHGLDLPQHFAPWAEFASLCSMVKQLRGLRIQLLHTRASVMGVVGRIAGRLARVPWLVHHLDDVHFRDPRLGSLQRGFFVRFERLISRLSDRNLLISQAVLSDVLAAGFNREQCVLVGLDLHPAFQEPMKRIHDGPIGRHPLLRKCGVPEDRPVIGCIGRLTQLKGIDTLIQAAAIVINARHRCAFFIRGYGPYLDHLKGMIAERGLEGHVVLCTESVPRDELPRLFRSFDLFVLPTRREGFGMVFAEAMALGVPVIGPRIAPITELVPANCGLLVEPENAQAYAAAIVSLLDDETARRALGARGHEHAHRTWVGSQAAERALDVYRELLFGRKKPS